MVFNRFRALLKGALWLALCGQALATPVLPANAVVEQAVKEALTEPEVVAARPEVSLSRRAEPVSQPQTVVAQKAMAPTPAPKPAPAAKPAAAAKPAPAVKPAPTVRSNATKLREQGVARAQQSSVRRAPRTAVVRATAYNSEVGQTDSTPFITATGTRTRFGVIALSRDLLSQFPYGTRVRLEDPSGKYNNLLAGRVFIVEDTMAARKRNSLDIWMSSRSQAMQWGARSIRITVIQ